MEEEERRQGNQGKSHQVVPLRRLAQVVGLLLIESLKCDVQQRLNGFDFWITESLLDFGAFREIVSSTKQANVGGRQRRSALRVRQLMIKMQVVLGPAEDALALVTLPNF